MRAWVLTDGCADREDACLGVAEAVAERIERRAIRPRALWRWIAPWGPIDPRDAPERGAGPISPRGALGWPDIIVGSGRVAAPYLMRAKRASGGRVVTVFLGPNAPAHTADLVAVLERDSVRGPNVIVTASRPCRVNRVRIAAARGGVPLVAETVRGRRVGVVIDGWRFTEDDGVRFAAALRRLRDDGAVLLVRATRVTSQPLAMALRETAHYLWDGAGPDPLVPVLAQSEALLVSAGCERSLSEAAVTGSPIMTVLPDRASGSARDFAGRLTALGMARPFSGRIERFAYPPLDSTREIAQAVHALAATRAALGRTSSRSARARTRETDGPASR